MPKLKTINDTNIVDYDDSNDRVASMDLQVTQIPLALYIHIPWCVKKCPYCDFNSHELPIDHQLSMYDDYVDALLTDARTQMMLTQGRQISSIFIGGGTPSLLPIDQYQRLFDGLRDCFEFMPDIEITMEANPGTLEHAPFAEYLKVGINRLSIGVQSFADDKLQALGRIHDPVQAISAIKAARAAGFNRVNVDLMHGLPQQTLTEALYDIQTAHNAGATHISWYQLTIEPNTVFYRSQPILPDENNLADIEQAGQTLLEQLGYHNYEVSAWAGASDSPCRHNVNYWQFGDYLAIGAGAHGKVTISKKQGHKIDVIEPKISGLADASSHNEQVTKTGIYRFSKTRAPKDYMKYQGAPKTIWQAIDQDELVSEFMLNALRLHSGVSTYLFEARTGLSIDAIAGEIKGLVSSGLLEDTDDKIQPTPLGQRYLNQILRAFL